MRTARPTGCYERPLEACSYLDEIGELPLSAQPKLLRVLETGQVTRIGESQPSEVDFRLVSATNRQQEKAVHASRFRADLYDRLAVVTIEIPPLRDRREDILPLAQAFLRTTSGESMQLSPRRARHPAFPCVAGKHPGAAQRHAARLETRAGRPIVARSAAAWAR